MTTALVASLAGTVSAQADATINGTIALDGNPVSGQQPSLSTADNTIIGDGLTGVGSADASLTLDGGTSFSSRLIQVGNAAGTNGNLTVTGTGSLTSTGVDAFIDVGENGANGNFSILNGGQVSAFDMRIGGRSGNGTLTVDGSGSLLLLSSELGSYSDPAEAGFGSFLQAGRRDTAQGLINVTNGGQIRITGGNSGLYGVGLTLGRDLGTRGILNLSGAGSSITIEETSRAPEDKHAVLQVGRNGSGFLNVTDGAKITLSRGPGEIYFLVGRYAGSDGAVLIDGQGSEVAGASFFRASIDDAGNAGGSSAVIVSNGGRLSADSLAFGPGSILAGNGTTEGAMFFKGGVLSPGNVQSIATFNHIGNFTFQSGNLITEIAGKNMSEYDRLAVSGDAILSGGTVTALFVDNFVPVLGDSFDIIAAEGTLSQTGVVGATASGLTGTGLDVAMVNGALVVTTAEGEQVETIKATTETTTKSTIATITTSITNRVTAIRFNSPRPATPSAAPTTATTGIGGSADNAGPSYGVWADGTFTRLDNDRSGEAFKGDVINALFGIDYFISNDLLIGGVFGYENSDIDLRGNPGQLETDGYSVTGYAAYVLNGNFTAIGQLGYTRVSTDLDDYQGTVTVSSDFDSDRVIASGSLLYQDYNGNWDYTGQVGYTYAYEDYDSYTSSDGTFVNPDNSILGQFRVGGELAYNTVMPQSDLPIVPFVAAGVVMDTISDDRGDDLALEYVAGVRIPLTNQLEGGLSIGGEELRSKEDRLSATLNIRYSF